MGYVPNECTLSGVPETSASPLIGCTLSSGGGGTSLIAVGSASTAPIGTAGVNAIWGVKADSTTTALPIDAWNMCRWIDIPSTPGSKAIFVPLHTQTEYTAFINSLPGNSSTIKSTLCSRGSANTGMPAGSVGNNVTIGAPYGTCTSAGSIAAPVNVYGRTTISAYPTPPTVVLPATFSCHGGSTIIHAKTTYSGGGNKLQWIARDPSTVTPGVRFYPLNWNLNDLYSPDIAQSASPGAVSAGANTTVSWSIVPFQASDTITCTKVPATGWGPDGAGMPRSGSSVYKVLSNTTFTLTCTSWPSNLTSVATSSVSVLPPPPPADAGGFGDGGGDGGIE
jgi:hypothetical protein